MEVKLLEGKLQYLAWRFSVVSIVLDLCPTLKSVLAFPISALEHWSVLLLQEHKGALLALPRSGGELPDPSTVAFNSVFTLPFAMRCHEAFTGAEHRWSLVGVLQGSQGLSLLYNRYTKEAVNSSKLLGRVGTTFLFSGPTNWAGTKMSTGPGQDVKFASRSMSWRP